VLGSATSGSDTFEYDVSTDQGSDVIHDFEAAKDKLVFKGVADFDGDADSDVADLDHPDSGMSVSDDGSNVTVDFGGNGSVRIDGIGTGGLASFSDLGATITLEVASS